MSDQAIARARGLNDIGRSDEAVVLLNTVLASEPDNVEALLVLAEAEIGSDPGAALHTTRRVIALNPEDVNGQLLAAHACLDLNRVAEASAHAREAVEQAPWLAQTHAVLAHALARRRRAQSEAMRAAERAIELEPNSAVGYNAAGSVALGRGKWGTAEDWFRKALEVDPHDAAAQANLVTAQEARGRLAPAFSDAGAMLRVDPRDEDARHVLDETVYTTLVHLLWVALVVLYLFSLFQVASAM